MINEDNNKEYQLKIMKINDTVLTVGYTGSLAGIYRFQITETGVRTSQPTNPQAHQLTAKIIIENIQPLSGSPYGGTVLTITGRNFSPDELENLVNVGDKPSTFCEIKEFNTTHIICIMPAKPDSYSNLSQIISVSGKLTEEAFCEDPNSCVFSYIQEEELEGIMIEDISQNSFDE